MSFRERLGPKYKIGPFTNGNKLGDEVKPGEVIYFDEGEDLYGGYAYAVRVLDPETAQIECHWDIGQQVINTYSKGQINRSPARGRLRWNSN